MVVVMVRLLHRFPHYVRWMPERAQDPGAAGLWRRFARFHRQFSGERRCRCRQSRLVVSGVISSLSGLLAFYVHNLKVLRYSLFKFN